MNKYDWALQSKVERPWRLKTWLIPSNLLLICWMWSLDRWAESHCFLWTRMLWVMWNSAHSKKSISFSFLRKTEQRNSRDQCSLMQRKIFAVCFSKPKCNAIKDHTDQRVEGQSRSWIRIENRTKISTLISSIWLLNLYSWSADKNVKMFFKLKFLEHLYGILFKDKFLCRIYFI